MDWLFPVMVLGALAASGFYRSARSSLSPGTFTEIKDLAFGVGLGCVLALGLGLIGHRVLATSEPASSQMVTAVLVAIVVMTAARAALRTTRQAIWGSRIVVVGSGDLTHQLQRYLGLQKGNHVVGHVVDATASEPDAVIQPGCLGTIAELPDICREHRVQRVVVGFPATTSPEAVAALRSLQGRVRLAIVPRFFELVSWRSTLTDLYGLPLLEVAAPHLSRWDRFLKRTLDVSVAAIALLVLFPILLVISVAVRCEGAPILFRQVRVGRDRRAFTIYKFRTMTTMGSEPSASPEVSLAPEGSGDNVRSLFEVRHKLDERERITRLGEFLRRTSLDEIPQFWNVLKGDMSLVGPRPFVPHESEDFSDWSDARFQVRPGITGLWQVSGRNSLSVDDLRRLDCLYVASWSLSYDFKILWDTPKTMYRGFGAY